MFRSAVLSMLLVAACGGSTAKPVANSATGTDAPATPGTSGVKTLDWGAKAEAVTALYPTATPGDGGLLYQGAVFGKQAITKFTIGASGLEHVSSEFTDGFPTMGECSSTWSTLRKQLDERYGASQSDNLAAYWKTTTASIVLACNPNDAGAGVLSLSYGHIED